MAMRFLNFSLCFKEMIAFERYNGRRQFMNNQSTRIKQKYSSGRATGRNGSVPAVLNQENINTFMDDVKIINFIADLWHGRLYSIFKHTVCGNG